MLTVSDYLHARWLGRAGRPDAADHLRPARRRAQRGRRVADTLPVSRPAVSQHLKILKTAGLVIDDAAGSRRIYRVNQSGLRQMRAELDTFWNDTLAAYKRAVEQPDPTSNEHTTHVHPPPGENR
jgi:DNA-binding transcriptional ArsR family regulator